MMFGAFARIRPARLLVVAFAALLLCVSGPLASTAAAAATDNGAGPRTISGKINLPNTFPAADRQGVKVYAFGSSYPSNQAARGVAHIDGSGNFSVQVGAADTYSLVITTGNLFAEEGRQSSPVAFTTTSFGPAGAYCGADAHVEAPLIDLTSLSSASGVTVNLPGSDAGSQTPTGSVQAGTSNPTSLQPATLGAPGASAAGAQRFDTQAIAGVVTVFRSAFADLESMFAAFGS